MADRWALLAALAEAGSLDDDAIDLGRVALLLASLDRDGRDPAPYQDHLAALGAAVASRTSAKASARDQAAAVVQVLHGEQGYSGDLATYDDVRNANLMDVIDRRKGLPVALGILCIHALRAAGGRIVGLNFPSHFVVRIDGPMGSVILDPFNDGAILDEGDLKERLARAFGPDEAGSPEHFLPVTDREILIRLQNNIKVRALAAGRWQRALAILESMSLIAPRWQSFWWEQALLHQRLGDVPAAIGVVERFLALRGPDAPADDPFAALLTALRRQIN